MSLRSSACPAFTTIEVLMALVILSIALIALETTAAVTLHRIADIHREAIAGEFVWRQRERVTSTPCADAAGLDSLDAVVVGWHAIASQHLATVTQQLRYPISAGRHDDSLRSVVACQ